MGAYRIAIRYQESRYHLFDVEADSLAAALSRAGAELPPEVAATADLAEVRRQPAPEERPFGRE